MLSINTNTSSLIAQNSMKSSTNKLNQAIERMTTGAKINHAKDNAANYSIATNMTTKINAYQVAEDNCAMGLDLISTASTSLEQMSDLTSRLRSLATQTQNGTYGNQSLDAINSEAQAIVQELNKVQNTTQYNKMNIIPDDISGFIQGINRRDTSNMTTFESVDENTELTSGTYSVSTADELVKLATMTNNGLIGEKTEFVLANDIDLSAYSTWTPIGTMNNPFLGTFDGNGYVIKNLKATTAAVYAGFFGRVRCVKNLGIENFDINNLDTDSTYSEYGVYAGILSADLWRGNSSGYAVNCYVKNSSICNQVLNRHYYNSSMCGGMFGSTASKTSVDSCYVKNTDLYVNQNGEYRQIILGGLTGHLGDSPITNCFTSNITFDSGSKKGSLSTNAGGIAGFINTRTAYLENVYTIDYNIGSTFSTRYFYGGTAVPNFGDVVNSYASNNNIIDYTSSDFTSIFEHELTSSKFCKNYFNFQIGTNSADSSQILLEISSINISTLDGLDMSSVDALSTIDEILKTINTQQTKLGAVQNRLESALGEISTQYDNLVSSRSTIQDADMAEVSSEYIKMQILQQASATLMATANQSPSIALQLL